MRVYPPAAKLPATARRGRPPKPRADGIDVRSALVRAGVAVMTEYGFTAAGLELVLKTAAVPKGSFYHYFDSKQDFTLAVIECYGAYFADRLERCLGDPRAARLQRIEAFCAEAAAGLRKYDYRRGCLIGQLGQELASLEPPLRLALRATLDDWERRLAELLTQAVAAGELAVDTPCEELAAFFWTGWEGAILRARLQRDEAPLALFLRGFLRLLGPFTSSGSDR